MSYSITHLKELYDNSFRGARLERTLVASYPLVQQAVILHCLPATVLTVIGNQYNNCCLDKLSMRGVSLGVDWWAWQSRVHPSAAASEVI